MFKTLGNLNYIEPFDEMPELKNTAINCCSSCNDFLNNEMPEIIALTRKGLRYKNRATIYAILKTAANNTKTEILFTKAQEEFQAKYEFDQEQNQFLVQHYQAGTTQ